ncbi:hypothetical protein SAMN05216579_2387 [Pseudomonas granadensis]|nr:hypothetical protein SAMN05216579_2387 [Pseudomonas granadensis]
MVEGVRFSGVFDYGVKGRLTKLSAGCLGVGWFSLGCMANSYKGWCLDVQDIPHITHALYLLTQDGDDLLQVAQQQMLSWKAPV